MENSKENMHFYVTQTLLATAMTLERFSLAHEYEYSFIEPKIPFLFLFTLNLVNTLTVNV